MKRLKAEHGQIKLNARWHLSEDAALKLESYRAYLHALECHDKLVKKAIAEGKTAKDVQLVEVLAALRLYYIKKHDRYKGEGDFMPQRLTHGDGGHPLRSFINTLMKINEVTNTPQTYMATVRVVLRDGSTTARTTVTADTFQQARLILTRIYGEGNVLGLSQLMSEEEKMTETTKTLSQQELQVKALSDKAAQFKQQAKMVKARQQMAKAQQNLMKASHKPNASRTFQDS